MATRYRANFLTGTASGVQANSSQLTITGTGWPTNIPAGSYLPIILNPGYYGATVQGEIAYVTSATSTVATLSARAQEGSTLVSGTNIAWVAAPIASDFDVTNLTSTGTLTLTNGLTVSGGNAIVSNNLTVSGFNSSFQGVTVSGGGLNVTGGGLSVYGNTTLNNNLSVVGSVSFPSSSIAYSAVKSYGPWYTTPNGTYFGISTAANTQISNVAVSGYNNYLVNAQFFVNQGTVTTAIHYGIGTVDAFGFLTYTTAKVGVPIYSGGGTSSYSYTGIYSPGTTASGKVGLGLYVDNNAGSAQYGWALFTVVGIN